MSAPESPRLFFNEDKTKLVREGDPEARFLAVANAGDPMPEGFKGAGRGMAEKSAKAKADPEATAKAAEQAANKQAAKAADKAAGVVRRRGGRGAERVVIGDAGQAVVDDPTGTKGK